MSNTEFIVNYAQAGVKHRYDQRHLGPGSEQILSHIDQRIITISDARSLREQFNLDNNGFELIDTDFEFSDFDNDEHIKARLYPQVIARLRKRLNATQVQIFDHTYRSKARDAKSSYNRAPVKSVHNDYTASSAAHRLHEQSKCTPLPKHDSFAFINVWMPLYHCVEESPLAMVDMRTVAPEDYHKLELIYPDRTGEIAAISYNPGHRWYYFDRLRPDEALLLKVFDSTESSVLNGVPHSAVEHANAHSFSHTRSSLELRTIAFFKNAP